MDQEKDEVSPAVYCSPHYVGTGLQSGTGGAGRKLPGLQFVKSRVTNGRG